MAGGADEVHPRSPAPPALRTAVVYPEEAVVVVAMRVKLFVLAPTYFPKTSMWGEGGGGCSYVSVLLRLPRAEEHRGVTDIS